MENKMKTLSVLFLVSLVSACSIQTEVKSKENVKQIHELSATEKETSGELDIHSKPWETILPTHITKYSVGDVVCLKGYQEPRLVIYWIYVTEENEFYRYKACWFNKDNELKWDLFMESQLEKCAGS